MSIGSDKARAMPQMDLDDHATMTRLLWAEGLRCMATATQHARASLGLSQDVDPEVLADPTLHPDALLAQMQASMAAGF